MNAAHRFAGINIAGIASAVPERILVNGRDLPQFTSDDINKITASIGVLQRHVVTDNQCTSDLCFAAADQLLSSLNWPRDSVDALIFISQTPDFFLPSTSCVLHGRLGLAKHCAALDINLGCSGYVYGLWQAANLIAASTAKRVLILVGDTISKITAPEDRSVALLFGDAGTTTALEYDVSAPDMWIQVGTDGTGYDKLQVPAGAFRQPASNTTCIRTAREQGNTRSEQDLYMNGAEIFAFTLREVPGLVKAVLAAANWDINSPDGFVMHQANLFMLKHIAKRLQIPDEKLLLSLEKFGNTSSASIPITLTHVYAEQGIKNAQQLLLAGFGVGFSWAGAALTLTSKCRFLPLIILKA